MLTVFFTTVFPLKEVFLFEPNLTVPGLRAKRVWSRPTETFVPAMMAVPRWRTIIEPDWAIWPSASLIPRYFGFESLKFLAVPPAFLCAICMIEYS